MSPQRTIAHYRIIAKLGEGGMGEVWRATDTKLNRDVAIKILPETFAQDEDRLARFTREAQLLAALNHPNIAAIYGVEERALVMELIEGPTLADRIAEGPIPPGEALPIAKQIAEGLEYAHDRGVIHRDLKPANIKITPEGRVKVLDFGLAKALSTESAPGDPVCSPTLTMRATMVGTIMGTAAYMSPEQAAGKPADKRSDIWSYGVVLYEMLTGKRLFEAESVSHTLADVLRGPIDFGKLPADTLPAVCGVLRRCLDRDIKTRLRDIGEARIVLEKPPGPAAPAPQGVSAASGWRILPWAIAVAVISALAALGWWRATRHEPHPVMRFSADLGPDAVTSSISVSSPVVISPDGTRIAYLVRTPSGAHLATRLMDQSVPTVLAGTEDAAFAFFHPGGQWIGFFTADKLKKISVQGGAAVALCDAATGRGASWGDDGAIIANLDSRHIFRVPEAGGVPQMIPARYSDKTDLRYRWPQILPGGNVVLVSVGAPGTFDDGYIGAVSLKTGDLKVVQRGGYFGRYLPSGHLIYVHQGTLFAVPFDPKSLQTRGLPLPVLDDVAANPGPGIGEFEFSQTGTFVYMSGKTAQMTPGVVWMDAAGKQTPLVSPPGVVITPRLSPDGKRLALATNGDIAVYDIERGSLSRITFTAAGNRYPLWTPDGKHIVYAQSIGGIWWTRADGSAQPQRILESNGNSSPGSFSPDGRQVAIIQTTGDGSAINILPLDTADPDHPKPGKPERFAQAASNTGVSDPVFSPDGRWLAYSANESGTWHVYVRRSAEGGSGGKWQVSTVPGHYATWSRTAKELFYETYDGHIMVTEYSIQGDTFSPGKPRQWCDTPIRNINFALRGYDLAPDGKRFVVFPQSEPGDAKSTLHVTFLLNFFDDLKRRMP